MPWMISDMGSGDMWPLIVTHDACTYEPMGEIAFTLPHGMNPQNLFFQSLESDVQFSLLNHYRNIVNRTGMPTTIYFSYGNVDGKIWSGGKGHDFLYSLRTSRVRPVKEQDGFVWQLHGI